MQERENADTGGDYEYDLAHEALAEAERAKPSQPPVPEPRMPEDGGDYSYDLAHDIPPAGS